MPSALTSTGTAPTAWMMSANTSAPRACAIALTAFASCMKPLTFDTSAIDTRRVFLSIAFAMSSGSIAHFLCLTIRSSTPFFSSSLYM